MAKVIKLRKGLDINLKGKATKETATVKCPGEYALVPDDFHGVKPKVVVKEGDAVKAGDALFVDKLHPSCWRAVCLHSCVNVPTMWWQILRTLRRLSL